MVQVKEAFADLDAMRIFYREIGDGPVLLLLHGGWMTGESNWGATYQDLARHFRVISPDHRGHGQTNNPDGRFGSYGWLAWDMINFCEVVGIDQVPLSVMGHSSGALISLHMSAFQPELITRQVLIGISRFIGQSDRFKAGMEQMFHTSDYREPPSMLRYVYEQPVNSLALWRMHRRTPWHTLLRQAWPMWIKPLGLQPDDYVRIAARSLVVCGTEDEFVSVTEAQDLSHQIADADCLAVAGQDHLFPVEDPGLLLRHVVPFLLGE